MSNIAPVAPTSGACLVSDVRESELLNEWLHRTRRTASEFRFADFEQVIRLVKNEQVFWTAVWSAGPLIQQKWFSRFFRAVVEADAELYSASDNTLLSTELLLFGIDNWSFLAPYVCTDDDVLAMTSEEDALYRISRRLRELQDSVEMLHERTLVASGVLQPELREADRLEDALSVKSRELLDASDPKTPLRGQPLAEKAGHQYDGDTRGHLSWLVKSGLLTKVRGGYIRASGK